VVRIVLVGFVDHALQEDTVQPQACQHQHVLDHVHLVTGVKRVRGTVKKSKFFSPIVHTLIHTKNDLPRNYLF
jgi:hypothetical protein